MQPDKNTPYNHHPLKTKQRMQLGQRKKWTKTLTRVSYLFLGKIVRQTEIARNRSAAALHILERFQVWNDFT